jgi:hypothetical protein
MKAKEFYDKHPEYKEKSERQDLNLLKITIRSGSFKGKELIFVEFVKFMNVNRAIIETLILKQKKEGFNYGKIKDVSFTFE